MKRDPFKPGQLVFGSLVPWRGEWYWSGEQRSWDDASKTDVDELKRMMKHESPGIFSGAARGTSTGSGIRPCRWSEGRATVACRHRSTLTLARGALRGTRKMRDRVSEARCRVLPLLFCRQFREGRG